METFMSGTLVIEGALLSFLLALWMTWMGLRGLFRLMPLTTENSQPIRFVANGQQRNRRRNAA
jgi:hypothetical protein